MAIGIVDVIREPSDAAPLLTLLPWAKVPMQHHPDRDNLMLLWNKSPLELAVAEEESESIQCMRFVSHRHSQFVLEQYFIGEFPGSCAKVAADASLSAIILQACLPLLPGTVVEVYPVDVKPNEKSAPEHRFSFRNALSLPDIVRRWSGRVQRLAPSTPSLRRVYPGDLMNHHHPGEAAREADEWDRDLLPLVQELNKLSQLGAKQLSNELSDIVGDLRSIRFLHYYNVPKVKFALHFAAYILYVIHLSQMLIYQNSPGADSNVRSAFASWMRHSGQLEMVTTQERFFFFWTITMVIGEFSEITAHYKATASVVEAVANYLNSFWNLIDLLLCLLVVTTYSLRLTCGYNESDAPGAVYNSCSPTMIALPRNLYAIILIIAYFRVMPYLRYYQSVGVLTIVLGSMAADVKLFFAVLMLITGGFSLAFAVLLPANMNQQWYHLGSSISLWQPFWGLFGQFDLAELEETIGPEMPTRLVAPLLLWCYLFTATIVLVNLLIAQMSDTYNRVTT